MSNGLQTTVYNQAQIQTAVSRVAREIAAWLGPKNQKPLHLISVMEGAKPFVRDLLKNLPVAAPGTKARVHEVHIKGTDGKSLLETREWVGENLDPTDFREGSVLIVDDLVDSGKTLKMLKEKFAGMGTGEVKTAVLIRKFGAASGPVDFLGFDLHLDRAVLAQKGLKDRWLFGYGMDLNGQYRDFEHIGWVEVK